MSEQQKQSDFYIQIKGQNIGPLSSTELQEYLNIGKIHDETLAIKNGTQNWQPIKLFSEFSVPAKSQKRVVKRKKNWEDLSTIEKSGIIFFMCIFAIAAIAWITGPHAPKDESDVFVERKIPESLRSSSAPNQDVQSRVNPRDFFFPKHGTKFLLYRKNEKRLLKVFLFSETKGGEIVHETEIRPGYEKDATAPTKTYLVTSDGAYLNDMTPNPVKTGSFAYPKTVGVGDTLPLSKLKVISVK